MIYATVIGWSAAIILAMMFAAERDKRRTTETINDHLYGECENYRHLLTEWQEELAKVRKQVRKRDEKGQFIKNQQTP